jgi:hypothetical protein
MQMADSAMEATPSGMSVVVHSSAAMTDLLANIRQSTARLGGGCVIYGAETMEGIIARSLAARRFTMALFGVFALAALALASIGIYVTVCCRTWWRSGRTKSACGWRSARNRRAWRSS